MAKAKTLTDRQIQEQINALEEVNRNTMRLSRGRGYGWGDDVVERRRKKILRLETILMARRLGGGKPNIPSGMALQKSLTKAGGQMHFRNGGGKRQPRAAGKPARKKKLKRGYGLSPFGVMPEGVRRLDV